MDKRYFDVNVFVYFLTSHPQFFERAKRWLMETDEIYISELTIFQLVIILSKLTGKREDEIFKELVNFLYNLRVKFIHLEAEDLPKVIEISEKNKLDFEDSIHYYLSTKVGELISNDKKLMRLGAKF
ncbi:type II toxin-antitoxin system VapC family toxin [Sulfolobus tengchongensis]|uniref:Type II toxin-antitoxin system VapC family toxin n=1 Tax=Sulfolobus tengchongensis TaxID=207809 RepID=A0AAX4KXS9_9CREN